MGFRLRNTNALILHSSPVHRAAACCLTDEPTRTRNRCLTSRSPRNRMKLPVPGFPRNDVGPAPFCCEDKLPQVPFICKDPLMESDGIKMLLLSPERLLCSLRDAGGGQDSLIGSTGCVIRAGDPGSLSCLVGELHHRQEEVGEQPE